VVACVSLDAAGADELVLACVSLDAAGADALVLAWSVGLVV
jgi:hypothetical protein